MTMETVPLPRPPFVSVIIPVYNGGAQLPACLLALEHQTYPRDRYEVIVVDNGSTDDSRNVAAQHAGVRLEVEPGLGSYAARNRGIAVAKGDVLAFTDADCIPAPDWIARGVAQLDRTPDVGLVGGRIEVPSLSGPSTLELYEGLFEFDQRRFIEHGRFAMTANLFTRASVLRCVGSFDAQLKSVGDREWGNRVAAAGYALAFGDDVVVRHPARDSMRSLLRKRLRVAGGHHDLAQRNGHSTRSFFAALSQQLVRKPLRGAVTLGRHRGGVRARGRVALFGLLVVLCYAEAIERIRLALGGRSHR